MLLDLRFGPLKYLGCSGADVASADPVGILGVFKGEHLDSRLLFESPA
jgi:hypothetical protein